MSTHRTSSSKKNSVTSGSNTVSFDYASEPDIKTLNPIAL